MLPHHPNERIDEGYFGAIDTDNDGPDFFEAIIWIFPASIVGFGADFEEPASGEVLQFFINNDLIVDFGDFFGRGFGEVGFLGIAGNSPFNSVTFRTRTDDSFPNTGEAWIADNLAFASTKPVPEPLTILGTIAAAGLGYEMKRKRDSLEA